MDNLTNHFKDLKRIRLPGEAKARIRERLISYVATNPPRERSILSPYIAHLRVPAFALLALVVMGGLTTYGATGALPGDTLYPVKLSVLEPAQSLFAFSPQARAELQVSVTQARLQEVEDLASKEKLTTQEGSSSQERFDQSLQEAQDTIDQLSKDDPTAAAKIDASLTTSLDDHSTALATLAVSSTTIDTDTVLAFADHVKDKSKSRKEELKVRHADAARKHDQSESGGVESATSTPTALPVVNTTTAPEATSSEKAD